MDGDYIRRKKPDYDDDLDYEQSKQMCADKGTFKPDNFIIESCISLMNKTYNEHTC